MKIRRILVPVDFSEYSRRALDYAVSLGEAFKPEFILLFALEPVQFAAAGHLYGAPVNVERLIEEQRRFAEADLSALADRVAGRGVEVRTVVAEGSPHRVIIDVAKRLNADLIVMGTHGRTGMSRFFMGSVAEMVARHAHCPVLTVRSRMRAGRTGGARTAKRKPPRSKTSR